MRELHFLEFSPFQLLCPLVFEFFGHYGVIFVLFATQACRQAFE